MIVEIRACDACPWRDEAHCTLTGGRAAARGERPDWCPLPAPPKFRGVDPTHTALSYAKAMGTGAPWRRLATRPVRDAPPRVASVERFVPPRGERSPSPRCLFWRERILAGWRPNRRISALGYHCAAEHYGIYIWEYLEVISPLLRDHFEGRE